MPGVGHFAATRALDDAVARTRSARRVDRGTPLLGICVGMQWLFEGSDEAPDVPGLGVFAGTACVCRTRHADGDTDATACKVPHVGWNSARRCRGRARLLHGVAPGAQVYFTHSYAAPVTADAAATTTTASTFAAAVERGRVFGVQFHPEKSGDAGLQILRNWLERAGAPLMLTKRIIACLDVRDGQVVKGVKFEELRDAGDPGGAGRAATTSKASTRSSSSTSPRRSRRARRVAQTIDAVAREIFLPLCVGGGIRTEDDAAAAVEAGADKVSLNTAALRDPSLITTLAQRYGSQAVIVAIDAKRRDGRLRRLRAQRHRPDAARDAVEWAREAADARRRRDPADVDRSRRHEGRLRLRADRRGLGRRRHPGDRLGRRRHVRPLRRRVHRRPRRRRAGGVDLPLRRTERRATEATSCTAAAFRSL